LDFYSLSKFIKPQMHTTKAMPSDNSTDRTKTNI